MIWQKAFKSPQLQFVIGVAILFWGVCCILVLHRYYNFSLTYVSFDQGIFNQVFWNSLHSRLFESSLSSTESASVMQGDIPDVSYRRLGQHFTPALLLWLPFYALFQSPAGLSILQVTLVTAAGFVLYALARHYHSPQLSSLIVVSYFGAIAVIGPTVANFHDICQIPLYGFGLLLALEKRRWWIVGILAILLLLVREDSGIILFSIGFYLVISRRYPRIGVGLCLLSLAYILLVTNLIMPLFSQDISQRFMVEQFGQFVDNEEASTLDVLWAIARNPGQLIVEIVTPVGKTISYLLGHWVPLAFVPLVAPEAWALAGFPLLKILLLKAEVTALSPHWRYAMSLVPGLFYGTILWWAKHPDRFTRQFRFFWTACIGLSLFFTLTANPSHALSWAIPDSFQPWVYVSPPQQWQHSQAVRSLLAQIPSDASVTATDQIVSHLSSRREALRFPSFQLRNDLDESVSVEYAIADLWYLQQYEPAFESYRESLKSMIDATNTLIERQYGLIGFEDSVVLLQNGANSNRTALNAWTTYQQELAPIFSNEASP
ncbi:DUF2079 domain-containing protein [Leptolyngbya sp. FACHB-541]|uniref:DUF2079 domain-containing protein n=1 Tax=Leptolyngbya sp. FACHB-541 TaxID=2692810 RepID=UPI0016885C3F|nr:DUF2079 domain-containing protein [Leptolyngbya sp. FACHB-541]MBD1995830.1 DUF2079 domain-containing protein [Leptolyngbya sp. FACHB-541]